MIKKILLGLSLLFVIALIALVALGFYLSSKINGIVKQAIEDYGPEVTQTSVTLDAVDLSFFSGNGSLSGLVIGNPEGFEMPNIFSLGKIEVDLEPKSLLSEEIVINRIYIKKPEISYEKTLSTSNLKELQKNIEDFTGPKTESEEATTPSDDSSTAPNVVIKEFILEEGTVTVAGLGFSETVTLPRIQLNNIGEDGNKEAIGQALNQLTTEILKAVGPALAGAQIDGVIDEAMKQVDGAVNDAIGDVDEKVNEALEKAGVGGENTEGLKDAANAVKGLFSK